MRAFTGLGEKHTGTVCEVQGDCKGRFFNQALCFRTSDRDEGNREENNLKKRIAAMAILTCAVMVLVVGAPLVTADTHHVVKGAQGPRASAVSWNVVPTDNGSWYGHIVN